MQGDLFTTDAYGMPVAKVFEAQKSESRKARGMGVAADARTGVLDLARAIARELCTSQGECTADDVGELLWQRHQIKTLGPAAGSLFKSGEFEPTGSFRKSTRKKNHARLLFVWRLKEAANDGL
jgi:hypothetical protein